jgi:hypothetical protein
VVIVSHNMAERSAILGAAESVIPGGRGGGAPQLYTYSRVTMNQRYTEITHDQLLFSIAQRICLTVNRETLTQYSTLQPWGQPWTQRAVLGRPARPLGPLVKGEVEIELTENE